MSAVTLTDVLREARPGRGRRIPTTREQRRRLGDEGLRALDLARHLLGARDALGARGRFPLTEHAAQAVARTIGTPIGQKRARRLTRHLLDAGIIEQAGSYPQKQGTRYRVRLWRLTAPEREGVVLRPASHKRPVGSGPLVKVPWWRHGLFGEPEGPPLPREQRRRMRRARRRMRSKDELGQGYRWSVGRDRSARLV